MFIAEKVLSLKKKSKIGHDFFVTKATDFKAFEKALEKLV